MRTCEFAWTGRLLLFAAVSACLTLAGEVRASVSIAVSWDDLLGHSVAAAVVTPVDARSVWEGGRIVTYTRVHVDKQVAGALPGSEDPWIRTLGGIIGKIGQRVEGEAVLAPGYQALVFLGAGQAGTFHVTARAQGQFPVVTTEASGPRVVRANAAGMLLKPTSAPTHAGARLAADVLHDRGVDDVARDIAADWERTHAH
jgi:hypothetical protein